MGLLDNFRSWWRGETRASYSLRDPALVALFGGHETEAGVSVTESTALQSSAVWSAVRVISESAGSLPLHLYQKEGRGRTRATDHPLYGILRDNPNPYTPALSFRETLLAHSLLWGNGYAEIERDLLGRPVALWILRPDWVTPEIQEDGTPVYIYRHPTLGQQELGPSQIFHIRGLGFDGLKGYSVVEMARDSMGLTIAAERFGARLFGSGAKPSGVLTTPGHLSDDALARLRRDFTAAHAGLGNSHRVAILENGLTWQAIGIPPEDAQFLQTRTFQLSEVARWFNIPSSKLRDNAGKSYSTLEQENWAFLSETLRPWLVRIEQEVQAKLLMPYEKGQFYAEHLVDGLLRADLTARYQAYAIARNWGWFSVNDIRTMENLDPVPGGDTYLQPLNMQALDSSGGATAPSATPAVGIAPPGAPSAAPPPDPSAGAFPADGLEENDLPAVRESVVALCELMTEHQVAACEHGSTNRCRICGIERERVLIPPAKPGGEHSWAVKWVPIQGA